MEDHFSEIRPYYDSELQGAFECLLADASFLSVIKGLIPAQVYDNLPVVLKSIGSFQEFQERIMYPILLDLLRRNGTELTGSGLDSDDVMPSLFVTNHRDIVTDPAFLDCLLLTMHCPTVQIAIGDNLLVSPWIKTLVRINKSFIVKRSYEPKEAVALFLQLSGYIRHAITEEKSSVWIAQREGRAKDSNDRTQESILKMFALSGEGSFVESLKPLHIRPTTISYEFDPCDYLKAKEFQQKRDDAGFVKSAQDDLLNMQEGILGKKGHIHYAFAPCINDGLDAIAAQTENRKEQVQRVKELIDKTIFANYVLYPINYVAYEALTGDTKYTDKITPEERITAEAYLEGQLKKIDLENADWDYLREMLLVMYANPLMNHYGLRE